MFSFKNLFKVDRFSSDQMEGKSSNQESDPKSSRIAWSEPPPEWAKKKEDKIEDLKRSPRNNRVVVERSHFLAAIERIESVLRSWYIPDFNKNQKHGCVIRSDENDNLVLEIGFDQVNKSNTIYGTIIEEGVCRGKHFSNLVLHNQLADAVKSCEDDQITITGSSGDSFPIFIEGKKVKSTVVNPWESKGPYFKSFKVNISEITEIAQKLVHGFTDFSIESSVEGGNPILYAGGIPKRWERCENKFGLGFVSRIDTNFIGGELVGEVKSLIAVLKTAKSDDGQAEFLPCRSGFDMKWENSYIRSGYNGSDVLEVATKEMEKTLKNCQPDGWFRKVLIDDSLRFFYNGSYSFDDASDVTSIGSNVDKNIRSYRGENMTFIPGEKVAGFVFVDESGFIVVDAEILHNVISSTFGKDLVINANFDRLLVIDGKHVTLVPSVRTIRSNGSQYSKRFEV